jgi:5-methyltetrahydrofolate--homocysteine methyltransferase
MGPTTKAITVTGGVTFNELREAYYTQAKGLVEGGVDLLLVETCQDTRNIKAAILAIQKLSKEIESEVPFVISVTIEPMGSMLAGQTVEAMWASLRHAKPLAFGMNCATGPEFMTDHIRTLSQLTGEYVSCYPNAGLPDEEGKYLETPTTAGKVCKPRMVELYRWMLRNDGEAHSGDRADGGGQEAESATDGSSSRGVFGD